MIDLINNGEFASSVREKLNQTITVANGRGYASIYAGTSQVQTVNDSSAFKIAMPSYVDNTTPLGFTTDGNLITSIEPLKTVKVNASLVVEASGGSTLNFFVGKDDVEIPQSKVVQDGDGQVTIAFITDIDVNESLSIWAQNQSNTNDFTISYSTFSVNSI